MKIRNSTERDFSRIMEIYSFARRYMAEHGNPNQWGPTNWPPEELIHSDIQSGNSYVCVNDEGSIIGTFYTLRDHLRGRGRLSASGIRENGICCDRRSMIRSGSQLLVHDFLPLLDLLNPVRPVPEYLCQLCESGRNIDFLRTDA